MITFTTREDPFIREKYRTGTHESGIRIIVIKKKIPAFSACVCVDFGARDLEYVSGGERFTLPPGTAHFLEHKMFEDPDGCDYMQRFEQLGGFANAYTSYRGTSFVCSGTREVYKNLGILLESVSSAHFTAASVARERDIIKREIVMYEDLPEDAAGQELLRMLYREHPLTKPISGTAGSVGRIGKATLARAFREFYVPSNMVLVVSGNVEEEAVAAEVEKVFGGRQPGERPETIIKPEPDGTVRKIKTARGSVATPIYAFGVKCAPAQGSGLEAVRHAQAMQAAVSLAFGRASDFYCRNYAEGIINERFYARYSHADGAAYLCFSGSGNEPERVAGLILEELSRRRGLPFPERDFLREKKAAYAESLMLFDSPDDVASAFAASAFLGYDLYGQFESLRALNYEEVNSALAGADLSAHSLSIIKPNQERGN